MTVGAVPQVSKCLLDKFSQCLLEIKVGYNISQVRKVLLTPRRWSARRVWRAHIGGEFANYVGDGHLEKEKR